MMEFNYQTVPLLGGILLKLIGILFSNEIIMQKETRYGTLNRRRFPRR